MDDYIITETMQTWKDDETSEIWYRHTMEQVKKDGDGTVLIKTEATGNNKKETRQNGRLSWIHALKKLLGVKD